MSFSTILLHFIDQLLLPLILVSVHPISVLFLAQWKNKKLLLYYVYSIHLFTGHTLMDYVCSKKGQLVEFCSVPMSRRYISSRLCTARCASFAGYTSTIVRD